MTVKTYGERFLAFQLERVQVGTPSGRHMSPGLVIQLERALEMQVLKYTRNRPVYLVPGSFCLICQREESALDA